MSEDLIVRHCSPTLAGLKTANLFAAEYTSEEALRNDLRALNRVLVPKGLRALPLRRENGRALIYLYRPKRLAQDLKDAQAAALLEPIGYPCGCPERCIAALVHRLKEQSAFPHEIGLFLGYPPEDVRGYIENRALQMRGLLEGLWRCRIREEKIRHVSKMHRHLLCVPAQRNNDRPAHRSRLTNKSNPISKEEQTHEQNRSHLLERHRQHRSHGQRGCGGR